LAESSQANYTNLHYAKLYDRGCRLATEKSPALARRFEMIDFYGFRVITFAIELNESITCSVVLTRRQRLADRSQ